MAIWGGSFGALDYVGEAILLLKGEEVNNDCFVNIQFRSNHNLPVDESDTCRSLHPVLQVRVCAKLITLYAGLG